MHFLQEVTGAVFLDILYSREMLKYGIALLPFLSTVLMILGKINFSAMKIYFFLLDVYFLLLLNNVYCIDVDQTRDGWCLLGKRVIATIENGTKCYALI